MLRENKIDQPSPVIRFRVEIKLILWESILSIAHITYASASGKKNCRYCFILKKKTRELSNGDNIIYNICSTSEIDANY